MDQGKRARQMRIGKAFQPAGGQRPASACPDGFHQQHFRKPLGDGVGSNPVVRHLDVEQAQYGRHACRPRAQARHQCKGGKHIEQEAAVVERDSYATTQHDRVVAFQGQFFPRFAVIEGRAIDGWQSLLAGHGIRGASDQTDITCDQALGSMAWSRDPACSLHDGDELQSISFGKRQRPFARGFEPACPCGPGIEHCKDIRERVEAMFGCLRQIHGDPSIAHPRIAA